MPEPSNQPQPTERDLANATLRQGIAARQNAQYHHAEVLALRTLGPGWEPSMKLTLYHADDCRPTGKDDPAGAPVAVAYQVSRRIAAGRLDRFVRELPDGEMLCSEHYEEVFSGMLDENHPTKTMEVQGEKVPTRRYQLYWSALERYEPRFAGELARLRANRERRKAEREEKKWAEENPLLAWADRVKEEEEG